MNIYRGPRTGSSWQCTDSKKPSECAKEWTLGGKIMFDGTVDKDGQRHTDLGIELEERDIIELFNILIRRYQGKIVELARELRELKTELKATRRTAQKESVPKKAGPKKAKVKRKPNPSFMKPLQPSGALAAIVGGKAIPRTQVVKKLWEYIRKHGLQDSENKRMINADNRLKAVFDGKRQVSMFDMTKLVNKHLS